jgi:hypothetical protein
MRLHYADKPNRLILFKETIPAYCGNHTIHINPPREHSAEFLNVIPHSIYTGNCA